MLPNNGRPGDVRGFVHKRLIGAVTGGVGALFKGGNPFTGAIGGFVQGGTGQLAPRGNLPTPFGDAVSRTIGRGFFPQTIVCGPGFKKIAGKCVPVAPSRAPGGFTVNPPFGGAPGVSVGFREQIEFGDAVMGRYGAALEPGLRPSETRVCPRGTVLALDGLCYNTRDIKNSERMWPRGRRPLLTGGDMRCISIAASAAKKIQKKTKQLQSMGMLKKPAPRRSARALPHAHHGHSDHE